MEKMPNPADSFENKLKKAAALGAVAVAALTGEGCSDNESVQKAPAKAPEPIVQKFDAQEKAAEDLLNFYISEISGQHLEYDKAGNIFVDIGGLGNFRRISPADMRTMKSYIFETGKKVSPNTSKMRRNMEEKALRIRIENHIQILCASVDNPSLLPPQMQTRYHELKNSGVIKDSPENSAFPKSSPGPKDKVRQSPDFE